MKNNLGDKERFMLLILFSGLILIYYIFNLFQSTINPLIKLLPFIAISIYVFIKSNQQGYCFRLDLSLWLSPSGSTYLSGLFTTYGYGFSVCCAVISPGHGSSDINLPISGMQYLAWAQYSPADTQYWYLAVYA